MNGIGPIPQLNDSVQSGEIVGGSRVTVCGERIPTHHEKAGVLSDEQLDKLVEVLVEFHWCLRTTVGE